MKKNLFFICLAQLIAFSASASDGLVHIKSAYSVEESRQRLVSILEAKGMTIFNQIAHSESAKDAGIELRPTQLILFGNPKVGSPLMKCAQSVAIDLPQKALIWQDQNDATFISYNSPDYLQARHRIQGCEKNLKKISKALEDLLRKAAGQ